MNAIRKLTAWTNKTAALGLVAVALAAFGTLAGPAPKVADIGRSTPTALVAQKEAGLEKDTELEKNDSMGISEVL